MLLSPEQYARMSCSLPCGSQSMIVHPAAGVRSEMAEVEPLCECEFSRDVWPRGSAITHDPEGSSGRVSGGRGTVVEIVGTGSVVAGGAPVVGSTDDSGQEQAKSEELGRRHYEIDWQRSREGGSAKEGGSKG